MSHSSATPELDAFEFGDSIRPRPVFATTHWSVVVEAGRDGGSKSKEALGTLCRNYWLPIYVYVRRRGFDPCDAEDLTQEFFLRLLAKKRIAAADSERGRFRSFLLTALNHFLADEWDRARAKKRGGGARPVSLERESAETRYQWEAADPMTPEKAYAKRWALTLLDRVMAQLRGEYAACGKESVFNEIKQCLTRSSDSESYAELASKLGKTEGSLRVAAHRLRQRYRELLRAEIASTLADPREIPEEMDYLFRALAG